MIDYSLILCTNYDGKQWSVGETYDSLQWLDTLPKPTKEELDSQWEAVQAYAKSQEYKAKRTAEYPPITEQLDTIFHKGLDAWKAEIQAIKDKYPKGA